MIDPHDGMKTNIAANIKPHFSARLVCSFWLVQHGSHGLYPNTPCMEMYGRYAYIGPPNPLNVDKQAINGWSGMVYIYIQLAWYPSTSKYISSKKAADLATHSAPQTFCLRLAPLSANGLMAWEHGSEQKEHMGWVHFLQPSAA